MRLSSLRARLSSSSIWRAAAAVAQSRWIASSPLSISERTMGTRESRSGVCMSQRANADTDRGTEVELSESVPRDLRRSERRVLAEKGGIGPG